MAIRVEEGTGCDKVVGEDIVVAHIAGYGGGFKGKVKEAGARSKGGERITIGKGEGKGGKGGRAE